MYDDKEPSEIPDASLEDVRQRALNQCAYCMQEWADLNSVGHVKNAHFKAQEASDQAIRAGNILREINRRAQILWDSFNKK